LQEFGAESMAMLDGGGSTGLIVDGKELLQANTKVPHGIAIYSDR
jgi:exopolysaccharide biosynthesis protein